MRLPEDRPTGLRLVSLAGPWWRIDHARPREWDWTPFPTPLHRFDSAGGTVRVRYAASSAAGAARERYRDTGSYVPADHAGHWLVALAGRVRVVDLRSARTLDALGLDDRISTSHERRAVRAAQQLADRAVSWWGEHVHGIAYRSRTTPASSLNLAFFEWAPLQPEARRLEDAGGLLDELIVAHGFTVGFGR